MQRGGNERGGSRLGRASDTAALPPHLKPPHEHPYNWLSVQYDASSASTALASGAGRLRKLPPGGSVATPAGQGLAIAGAPLSLAAAQVAGRVVFG
eukprot:361475-Chlamydomonas_euryale.AAC.1